MIGFKMVHFMLCLCLLLFHFYFIYYIFTIILTQLLIVIMTCQHTQVIIKHPMVAVSKSSQSCISFSFVADEDLGGRNILLPTSFLATYVNCSDTSETDIIDNNNTTGNSDLLGHVTSGEWPPVI